MHPMTIDALGTAYGLDRPTVADLHAQVTAATDGDPQLWSQLCRTAQVGADTTDPAGLAPLLAAALQTTTGTMRLAVMSLDVRLRTHTALTAL